MIAALRFTQVYLYRFPPSSITVVNDNDLLST